MDILKQLPDKCIDLVLTDPPYGIGYDNLYSKNGGTQYGKAKAPKRKYDTSNWDSEIPSKEIFKEIFRVSKNQIIFGGNYFANMFNNSKCWLVWDKHINGCFADCELAWTSFDKPVKKYDYLWNGMLQENMKHKEIRIHPTQKPVGLLKQILRDYYKEGIVLDCFSGSGSTAIACYDLNIPFIAIEKDKDYWKASVERLENAQAQLKLF